MEKSEPQSNHCYVLPNSLNIILFLLRKAASYLEYAGETQYGLSSAALAWRKMASRGLLSSVLSKAMFFTMYDDRVPPWVPTRPPRPVSKEKNPIRNKISMTIHKHTPCVRCPYLTMLRNHQAAGVNQVSYQNV